jgi:hypothetical protein
VLLETPDLAVVLDARRAEAERVNELRRSATECPRCGDTEWIYDPEIDGHYCLACEHSTQADPAPAEELPADPYAPVAAALIEW